MLDTDGEWAQGLVESIDPVPRRLWPGRIWIDDDRGITFRLIEPLDAHSCGLLHSGSWPRGRVSSRDLPAHAGPELEG
jgi:hypothetical protein